MVYLFFQDDQDFQAKFLRIIPDNIWFVENFPMPNILDLSP